MNNSNKNEDIIYTGVTSLFTKHPTYWEFCKYESGWRYFCFEDDIPYGLSDIDDIHWIKSDMPIPQAISDNVLCNKYITKPVEREVRISPEDILNIVYSNRMLKELGR